MTAPTQDDTDTGNDTDTTLAEAVKEAGKVKKDPPAEAVEPAAEDAPAEDPPVDEADVPAVREDGKPFTAKDHTALSEALKKARKDARDASAELAKVMEAAGGKDVSEALADADTRAMAKFKPLMVKAAARSAFTEAGLSLPANRADEVFARAVKLLDADALTITDDGLVEGLAEQVEAIRADFPDLFSTSRRAPRIQAADRKTEPAAPKSAAERLAAGLMGRNAP